MELVRHRILMGTCPECGTRLTGQERGESTDDDSPIAWALVKQWCYNGCLSATKGAAVPAQRLTPDDTARHPARTGPIHLIIGH